MTGPITIKLSYYLQLQLFFFRHGKDELFTKSDAKHMLVFRKGHMYLFDAIDKDGKRLKLHT